MKAMFACVNTRIVPLSEVCIPLTDNNYASGYAVYETVKMRSGKLYFLPLHLDRLFHSAEILGMCIQFTRSEIEEQLRALMTKNNVLHCNVRILAVRRSERSVNCYIHCVEIPLPETADNVEFPEASGVNAMLYRGERQFPQAKSMNLALSLRARGEAEKKGCWDALLVDSDSEIREGSRSTLYWFEDNALYMPCSDKILQGVTSINFAKALAEHGIAIRQGALHAEDLSARPRPLLVSSTSAAIQPVLRVLNLSGTWISLPQDERILRYAGYFGNYLRSYAQSL